MNVTPPDRPSPLARRPHVLRALPAARTRGPQYQLRQKTEEIVAAKRELAELKMVLTAPTSEWLAQATRRLQLEARRDEFVDELLRAFALSEARLRGDAYDIEKAGGTAPDAAAAETTTTTTTPAVAVIAATAAEAPKPAAPVKGFL